MGQQAAEASSCETFRPYAITLDQIPAFHSHVQAHRALSRATPLKDLEQLFPRLQKIPGVLTGTIDAPEILRDPYRAKAGVRGCAMAHRELWSLLQHKPGPHLILEDDAVAREPAALCARLQSVREDMIAKNVDLVNLGPSGETGDPSASSWGTFAYMLSQRGAALALKHTDSVRYPIDEQLIQLCRKRVLRCDIQRHFQHGGGGNSYTSLMSTTRAPRTHRPETTRKPERG